MKIETRARNKQPWLSSGTENMGKFRKQPVMFRFKEHINSCLWRSPCIALSSSVPICTLISVSVWHQKVLHASGSLRWAHDKILLHDGLGWETIFHYWSLGPKKSKMQAKKRKRWIQNGGGGGWVRWRERRIIWRAKQEGTDRMESKRCWRKKKG